MFKGLPDINSALIQYLENPKKRFRKGYFLPSFVDSAMGVLQKIPLMRNGQGQVSADATFKNLSTLDYIDEYPSSEYKKLLEFFSKVPSSQYMVVGDNPRLGSFTPIFMAAHKEYHNVGYEEWCLDDTYMGFALGKGLEWLITVRKETPESLRSKIAGSVDEYRTMARKKKDGVQLPVTSHLCLLRSIEGVEGSKFSQFWLMVLQLWIANATKRVIDDNLSSLMILDPWDWDLVPEAHDAEVIIQKSGKVVEAKEVISEDLPW